LPRHYSPFLAIAAPDSVAARTYRDIGHYDRAVGQLRQYLACLRQKRTDMPA
jgi:hypothetical protein